MFKTSNYLDDFIISLKNLNEIVEKRAKLNLLDSAVLAESFYKELLNKLFSWRLDNLNITRSNFEAIDLIDKTNKVIIQVSCTCENKKIRNTLSKNELKKEEYKDFSLYFLFIGNQNKNVKKAKYTTAGQLIFNAKQNIFLTEDIIKVFQYSSPDMQSKVIEIIQQYLFDENNINNAVSKKDLSRVILEKLDENSEIFFKYGPHSQLAMKSPYSKSSYQIWEKKKKEIIANNNIIIELYNKDQQLFERDEKNLFNKFKLNAESFEQNNKKRLDSNAYESFPKEFPRMLESIIEN
jgi:hypothetical protein